MSQYDYEPLDMGEIGVEQERVTKEPGGAFLDSFIKLPEDDGFVLMRFLPRRKGQPLYCATRTHRLGHGQDARSFHCPRCLTKTENGPFWLATEEHGDCVICKYYKNMWQKSLKLSGKAQEELQGAARLIKPVERFYYNVIARTQFDKKTNKITENVGPLIFSCGKTVHAMILAAIMGDVKAGKKSKGDITDPKTGRDFRLVKKIVQGSGGKTFPSYDTSEWEEPSAAGEPDQFNKWVENLHDLQKLRVLKDEATLSKALKVHLGLIAPTEEDWSEYEGGSPASVVDEPTQEVSTKPIAKQSKPASAKAKEMENEILADPKFMAEIEGLNADD